MRFCIILKINTLRKTLFVGKDERMTVDYSWSGRSETMSWEGRDSWKEAGYVP